MKSFTTAPFCWLLEHCGAEVEVTSAPVAGGDQQASRHGRKAKVSVGVLTSSTSCPCRQRGRCRGSACWRTWRRRGCRRRPSPCAMRYGLQQGHTLCVGLSCSRQCPESNQASNDTLLPCRSCSCSSWRRASARALPDPRHPTRRRWSSWALRPTCSSSRYPTTSLSLNSWVAATQAQRRVPETD